MITTGGEGVMSIFAPTLNFTLEVVEASTLSLQPKTTSFIGVPCEFL